MECLAKSHYPDRVGETKELRWTNTQVDKEREKGCYNQDCSLLNTFRYVLYKNTCGDVNNWKDSEEQAYLKLAKVKLV